MKLSRRYSYPAPGFSLIELMIAMLIGLLIVLGVTTLFLESKQNYRHGEMLARMQEDARFVIDEMVDDIALAGFWSDLFDPSAIFVDNEIGLASDCGDGSTAWMYRTVEAMLAFDDNTASAGIDSQFECVNGSVLMPLTDALMVKHVEPASMEQKGEALAAGQVYLLSNGAIGLLYENKPFTPDIAVPAPRENWRYAPRLYFVRNFFSAPGDNIPTLCRFQLAYEGGSPAMKEECLAPGVESLQVEFGIDSDFDGIANRYVSGPSATLVADNRIATVRLHLLMRSLLPDPSYVDRKTYRLGNRPAYLPGDHHHRRSYTTTIMLRNVRNLSCLNSGC